jgi:hypothetical protein
MIASMASCASCGADGIAPDQVCPRCGARSSPELELELRAPPGPRAAAPRKKIVDDISFDLAVDPRELVAQRTGEGPGPPKAWGVGAISPGGIPAAASVSLVRAAGRGSHHDLALAAGTDVHADARVLADYGEPPRGALQSPLYAWRVLKRQRELKTAHGARRVEAEHAASVLEDALVAFAARARPVAEKQAAYAGVLEDLQRAEDVLRSRDEVLAAEQDAQKARLAQVDARLAKLEEEVTQAHTDERMTAQELSSAQGALAREEAKLKRAEAELRAAQQREPGGTGG